MAPLTSFTHPKDEILQTMERIYNYRMTTTSGGNISIREENGEIWITPARVDKGNLRREDMVCMRGDQVIEGRHPPSSEYPFHVAIYDARPDLRAIVHAHPVALVAFSVVHRVPDTRLFHQARHVCGEAGFADYELPGSAALGVKVAAIFMLGFDSVILENHGVVTGGVSLQDAFHRFETLEFAGKTVIKASILGDVRYLDDEALDLPETLVAEVPMFDRAAPTSSEKEARQKLCEFVHRAYRQRLFISTQGSFSARLDETSFLVTPYRVDRGSLEPRDLVLVRDGRAEAGSLPSRATVVHAAIYQRHPAVGAIINAYPVNATAFSVCGAPFDSRIIPESYVVLRHVGRAPYGLQFENPDAIARMIAVDQPSVLLENDGVLVTGSNILEAFDRLEVLESTAEAIINSKAIGMLAPMPDSVIDELDRVFLGKPAA